MEGKDGLSRYETLRRTRLRRKCKPKGIPIEELIALRLEGLSVVEVAERLGVTHQTVGQRLRAVEGRITGIKHFKKHRADVLAMKQSEILNSISEEDLSKVSLQAKTVAFGVLYDKERLERGKSTENVCIAEVDATLQELEEKERAILKELDGYKPANAAS